MSRAAPTQIPKLKTGLHHATCVSVQGRGLLILGASGSGKSALALGLMALGADLVGDDQVELMPKDDAVIARPAPNLAGKIEARFVGILDVRHIPSTRLHTVVDLSRPATTRLPSLHSIEVCDKKFPFLAGMDVPNLANALYVLLTHP